MYLFRGQDNSSYNTTGRKLMSLCLLLRLSIFFTVKYLGYLFGSKNITFFNRKYIYLMLLYAYCFHLCLLNTQIGTLPTPFFSRSGYFVLLYHKQKIDVFMSTFTSVYFFHGLVPCLPFPR